MASPNVSDGCKLFRLLFWFFTPIFLLHQTLLSLDQLHPVCVVSPHAVTAIWFGVFCVWLIAFSVFSCLWGRLTSLPQPRADGLLCTQHNKDRLKKDLRSLSWVSPGLGGQQSPAVYQQQLVIHNRGSGLARLWMCWSKILIEIFITANSLIITL